jgi:glycine/D-amino acid oxidase-like deaminating enzyme
MEGVKATSWSADALGVRVETTVGAWEADRLVIAAGAWAGTVMADLGIPLEVRRKPVIWFNVDEEYQALAEPERMPVFISDDEYGEFYGIPHFDVPGVKVGMHSGGQVVGPETIDRSVSESDIRNDIWPFIQRNLNGFTGAVTDTAMCMYTMTPDEDFVLDRHPEFERVVYAAGFSGHGFKFAPVVGAYLASLVTDSAAPIVPDFASARFTAPVAHCQG